MPFAVESSHIPSRICPGVKKEDIEDNGLYKTLETYGLRPNVASEMIAAVIIEGDYQSLLKTLKGTPGFFVQRMSFSGALPVEYCECYVNGEVVKYNIAHK